MKQLFALAHLIATLVLVAFAAASVLSFQGRDDLVQLAYPILSIAFPWAALIAAVAPLPELLTPYRRGRSDFIHDSKLDKGGHPSLLTVLSFFSMFATGFVLLTSRVHPDPVPFAIFSGAVALYLAALTILSVMRDQLIYAFNMTYRDLTGAQKAFYDLIKED